jgi:large subunit ribosomal protein L4
LAALGIADKKSLWVLGAPNQNVYLSGRNLNKTEVLTNDELNTYKIMNAQHLVLAESAVVAIEANLSK